MNGYTLLCQVILYFTLRKLNILLYRSKVHGQVRERMLIIIIIMLRVEKVYNVIML